MACFDGGRTTFDERSVLRDGSQCHVGSLPKSWPCHVCCGEGSWPKGVGGAAGPACPKPRVPADKNIMKRAQRITRLPSRSVAPARQRILPVLRRISLVERTLETWTSQRRIREHQGIGKIGRTTLPPSPRPPTPAPARPQCHGLSCGDPARRVRRISPVARTRKSWSLERGKRGRGPKVRGQTTAPTPPPRNQGVNNRSAKIWLAECEEFRAI